MTSDHKPSTVFRIAIGAHLVAVGVCVLLSRLDSLDGFAPDNSLRRLMLSILLLAALLAWLICPVTVIVAILRRGISRASAYALLAETILAFVQIFTLLPLVQ